MKAKDSVRWKTDRIIGLAIDSMHTMNSRYLVFIAETFAYQLYSVLYQTIEAMFIIVILNQ